MPACHWIDTHCHLNLPQFADDLEQVIQRAQASGVGQIIVPGINLATSKSAKEMAEKFPAVFFACGVHPNDSVDFDESMIPQLAHLAAHPKCVAIGEIGLDFYRDYCPSDQQIRSFKAQLQLASNCGKPVLIHCRQAFSKLWPLLIDWQRETAKLDYPGVLHAFDETALAMQEVTQSGFMIGIGGAYTYAGKSDRQEILKTMPLVNVLLETDAPYLTPIPHRGKRNEPAYIPIIAKKIAEERLLSAELLCACTFENTVRLFPNMQKNKGLR